MNSRPAGGRVRVTLAVLGLLATACPLALWPDPVSAEEPDLPAAAAFPTARDEVIALVLVSNPDLASARFAWEAASAHPAQVGALPDPMLTWGVAPATAWSDDVAFGQRIELRQAVPFPGTLAHRAAAAEARAAAMGEDVDALGLHLALEAARLVDGLALVESSLALLTEHATLLGELKASALARYAASRAGAQDPIQADVELAHVEHRMIVLDSDGRVLLARLNALLHREPDAVLTLGPLDSLPPDAPALTTSRPEVRAAEARERAAEESLVATRRSTLPDLAVWGSYNSMWMAPEDQWMLGIGVEVPLQVGARRAEVQEALALAAASTASRDAVEDRVAAEVEAARARYAEALHVVRLHDDRLVPAARMRVEVARAAFESGSEDFDTLIDAERALRDAELGGARSVSDAWTRHAELQVASGQIPSSNALQEVTP